MHADTGAGATTTRNRIIAATITLLTEGGREAVSTRAVGAAAGVQAPAIYRLFGDMQGLLDAVAEDGVRQFLLSKQQAEGDDPVEDLRRGWDQHVAFGLANPALYALMHNDRRSGPPSPAAQAAATMLVARLHRIAAAGRLRVSEVMAADLLQALGDGAIRALIAMPPSAHRRQFATLARETAIAAITIERPPAADQEPALCPVGIAVALRAVLPETTALTRAEQGLMMEWLDRLAESARR